MAASLNHHALSVTVAEKCRESGSKEKPKNVSSVARRTKSPSRAKSPKSPKSPKARDSPRRINSRKQNDDKIDDRNLRRKSKSTGSRKNPFSALDTKIKIYSAAEDKYYQGLVGSTFDSKGRVTITYDDGSKELVDLSNEHWNYV